MSTVSNCAEAFTLYNVQKYTKVCNFQNTDWWALRAGLVAIAWLAVLRTWLVARRLAWLVALRAWLGDLVDAEHLEQLKHLKHRNYSAMQ